MSDIINNFKLDFLGLVTLFGGDTALAAIHYCVLERRFSAYLSPGMFFVGIKLLRRTDNFLSKSLAPGPRDNCSEVVGLMSTGNFRYTGMLSGTKTSVGNSIGEAILHNTRRRQIDYDKTFKRPTRVDVIYESRKDSEEVENPEKTESSKNKGTLPISRNTSYRDIILSIINLGMFAYVVWLQDVIGAIIIITGAITNMLLTYAASASGGSYPSVKVAKGCPPGNAVVKNESFPDQLWVVLGNEEFVQRLLQRPITVELNNFWQLMNLFAGISVYLYTIFSILALPSVATLVQIIIGGLLLLGLLVNMTYASRGDKFLTKPAKRDMHVESEDPPHVFSSRTAAIAYCVLRCESTSKHTDDLLPNTLLFNLWRDLLTHFSTTKEPSEGGIDNDIARWTKDLEENKRKEIDDNESLWEALVSGIKEAMKVKAEKEAAKKTNGDHHPVNME